MTLNVQLKMITFTALIVLLFVALSYLYQNQADATTVNISVRQTHSIRVVRMRLQGLRENRIDTANEVLSRLPGVTKIKLEPSHKKVTVWVDIERTNLKTIEQSLHTAGFTPLYR